MIVIVRQRSDDGQVENKFFANEDSSFALGPSTWTSVTIYDGDYRFIICEIVARRAA